MSESACVCSRSFPVDEKSERIISEMGLKWPFGLKKRGIGALVPLRFLAETFCMSDLSESTCGEKSNDS